MKVNLKYFKKTGKFYSEGDFVFHPKTLSPWHEAIEKVLDLQNEGKLPGLIEGSVGFIILVTPEHYINDIKIELSHIILPKNVAEFARRSYYGE